MGTNFLLLRLSFATKTPPPPLLNHNNKLSTGNRPSGPYWAWKNQGPTSTRRSKFHLEDELDTDSADYGDDKFGYSGTGKQRAWWFDDDDDDDWDVDNEENEFWVFKVIKAFGWMLPAVAISFLLGTDSPNGFFMALAVSLGQAALSLVMDKVWGTTSTNPKRRPRTKTRKKPFAGAASKTKTTERKAEEYKTNEGKGSYQSRMATDDGSNKKDANRVPSFGGWDDLDRASYKAPGRRSQKGDELPKQNKGKLSRRGRVRDRPLLLRLLIAVFPFLASWSRFLF